MWQKLSDNLLIWEYILLKNLYFKFNEVENSRIYVLFHASFWCIACFETVTFSHMWLNFRDTKRDYFCHKLAYPEHPFVMRLLVVKKQPFLRQEVFWKFNTLNTFNSSIVFIYTFILCSFSFLITTNGKLGHL